MSTNQFRHYLDLLNEDPELSNPTQSSSEPRCATCGTPKSQHQELKHPFLAGGAADRPAPVAQGGSTGGGDVGRIKKLQAELKAAGAELGSTGANRDGIDGDIGPLTTTAMSKYPDIADKYPDLRGSSSAAPTGQAATPAVDTKKLDAALSTIEGILTKYKVKLSEDRESSTTDQMKQWRSLMELSSAEMDAAAAKRKAAQASNQSKIDAKFAADAQAKNFGPYATVGTPAQAMPYSQAAQQPWLGTASKTEKGAAGAAEKGTASAAKKAADGVVKGALKKLAPGVGLALAVPDVYDRTKAGDYTGAAISGLAGLASLVPLKGTAVALGLGGLNAWLDSRKTPTTAISVEDAKTIIDNVKILQDLAKDPANQDALTPELKTRIANTLKGVSSLGIPTQDPTPSSAQQAATPTAPQPAATPTAPQPADTPAAKAAAALPTAISTADSLDKLLKKNNFESREYTTLGEQLAHYRDIVNETSVPPVVTKTLGQWAKDAVEPIARRTVQGASLGVLGGTGYGGYQAYKWATAPAAMSAEDKAEFDRLIADFTKTVPDQATFNALPQPVKDKYRDVFERLEKMKQQGK
jgi:hypothetical protein